MNKWFYALLFVLSICLSGYSQDKFVIQNKKQSDKIRFKSVNNLIIIPLEINGVTLSFLLDTGVSKPIIFNFLNVSDSLKIKNTTTIHLRGLGGGDTVEALKSTNNVIKIGEAVKLKQDLYAVFNNNLNFAPRLGVPVHGIIGLDVFKDLVVEINYASGYLRLTMPEKYKYKSCKKCERINLEFYNGKPYINAKVTIKNKEIPVKLLIDSGGSDALWLFEDDSLGITCGDKYFEDFLGLGLNGSVYGKRSKIEAFSLNSFVLKDANVAYPNDENIFFAKKIKDRNGSVSGNILKRFNIIFDYQNAKMTISKNSKFKESFSYNKSGMELAHDGVRILREIKRSAIKANSNTQSTNDGIVLGNQYKLSLKPAYAIVELRSGSPAEEAGLQIGDIIISINGKQTYQLSLQQVMHLFYEEHDKKMKIRVDRNGKYLTFNFKLKKLL
ncbi:retropepsin-like aspartic protease [Algibacter luteus]|uniref:Aspartyl protease n=1 Tax=Algibacter luteus TaxID=1178825 RepID=A0A1M6GBX2_9FLAO|nr:aspartyl protease family protein [Algibacter luteus]SHJ07443.1 Aspartyl protease [Algibacter luteus]